MPLSTSLFVPRQGPKGSCFALVKGILFMEPEYTFGVDGSTAAGTHKGENQLYISTIGIEAALSARDAPAARRDHD